MKQKIKKKYIYIRKDIEIYIEKHRETYRNVEKRSETKYKRRQT